MGLALHEMYEVSGLMIRDVSYEKYVPSMEELHLLQKSDPLVQETYWEVLCHFHICGQVTGWRSGRIKQMSWETYLFQRVNKANPVSRLAPALMRKFLKESAHSPAPTPPSLMKIPSNQIQSLRASIIKPKSRCLTGLCWRVSSCCG